MKRTSALALTALFVAGAAGLAAHAQGQTGRGAAAQGLSPELRNRLNDSLAKATTYLRSQQQADGTWERNPGITGMVVGAVLRNPAMPRAERMAMASRALDSLRKLAKPDGGIYERDIPHYITAVSTMALVAAGQPQDKSLIEKARQYLADHLFDEGEGVPPGDKFYGGLGYGGTSDGGRADIISLEFGLRAMKEADLPANNAAWDKAIRFLQRTQNNSESNDQGWATNDGGFIYYPGFSQAEGTRSYGSATYAGILSYSWANLKKTDPRVQAVLKWVRDNYTVDENPGIGQKTVYYYYMVFAKALQAVNEPVILDSRGQRHNWREDLARKLLSLQHPEGYWVNTDRAEMQDNKVLVTAFTMMAIEATLGT
jgi:squalene-hopene/tetraprenyl-beta-curcumene cyclase